MSERQEGRGKGEGGRGSYSVSCLLPLASCCLLLSVLVACVPATALSPQAVAWLEAYALPVERVAISGGGDFGAREVVSLPRDADTFGLLALLDAERPDYVLAGAGVAWDSVRAQAWFTTRYRAVATWREGLTAQTLFAYTPSPFDAGERVAVTARFATDAVVLRAYRVSHTRLIPGEPLYVTLYWDEGVPDVSTDFADWTTTVQLIAVSGATVWAQARARLHPTGLTWDTDARLAVAHTLTIPPDLPTGDYGLVVGLVARAGPAILTVAGESGVTLTPLSHQPAISRAPLTMDYRVRYAVGEAITLRGYDAPSRAAPGDDVRISLYWHALSTLAADYKVFVHLVSSVGAVPVQEDGVPVGWTYPTTAWQSGDDVRDDHTLALPLDLPRGDYVVAVGLYDAISGERLPISDAAGELVPDARVLLCTLRVR